jgi:hypothetical protein
VDVYKKRIDSFLSGFEKRLGRELRYDLLNNSHFLIGDGSDKTLRDILVKASLLDVLLGRELNAAEVTIYRTGGPVKMDVGGEPKLLEIVSPFLKQKRREYWFASRWNFAKNKLFGLSVQAIYCFRNYIVDGFFPVLVAALAIAALYQVIDLKWLRHLSPPQ